MTLVASSNTILQTILEEAGLEVLAASSAQQAIRVEAQFTRTIHLLLSDIMMPYFMKKTRELFLQKPGQTCGRLVHYTTAEAALNIIRTKRFWMRNTNCLSDFSEVQHGFDILQRFLAIKEKKESFTDALDDCIPGDASQAFTAFNNSWNDIRWNS